MGMFAAAACAILAGMDEDDARQWAVGRLINGPGPGTAETLGEPISLGWAWVFPWGPHPRGSGLVVVVEDVEWAWVIRSDSDASAERFTSAYTDMFREAFDPEATRQRPRQLVLDIGSALGSSLLVRSVAAFMGLLAGQSLFRDGQRWAALGVGVVAVLATIAFLALLRSAVDRHVVIQANRALAMRRYAHVIRPLAYMYLEAQEVGGADHPAARNWAEKLEHAEKILARNGPGTLERNLAQIHEMLRAAR